MYGPLTTLDKVKRWLDIPTSSDNADGLLEDLIASTSELIGRFCARDNLGEVISYVETYWRPPGAFSTQTRGPRIVLNHWPVVALQSVNLAGQNISIITNPLAPVNQSGAFVENDGRTLSLLFLAWPPTNLPIVVSYTSGYDAAATVTAGGIPPGLTQACNQWIGEVYKSKDWIGYRSKVLAGESVTYDTGKDFGMSPRTLAMIQPYRNRIPVYGNP